MAKRVGVDKWIFFTTLLLVSSGWRWCFRRRPSWRRSSTTRRMFPWGGRPCGRWPACCAMIVLMRIDYTHYNSPKFIYPALALRHPAGLVFFFHESHNTHRWIRFGGFFTFQPSEIAKPILILFLAWFLHTRLDQMRDWKNTLLRAAFIPVVFILLMVEAAGSGNSPGAGRHHRSHAGAGRHGVEVARSPASPPRLPPLAALLLLGRLAAAAHARLSPSANPIPRAPASTSISRSSPSAAAASPAAASWRACRSSSICPKRPPTSSLPTSPRSLASSAPCASSSCSSSSVFAASAWLSAPHDPFARLVSFGITVAILLQAFFNISVVLVAGAHQGNSAAADFLRRNLAVLHPRGHRRPAQHLAED